MSNVKNDLLNHAPDKCMVALVLIDVINNNCVLFTACDAHMRNYQLVMPEDCVGAQTLERKRDALRILQGALTVRITRSSELDLAGLLQSEALHMSESSAKAA